MIEKIAEATIDLNIVEGGEGGSSIVYQSTTPPASDYQSGDTWFKTDANNNVVEVYAHDGSTWDKKEYTSGALDMEDVQSSMIRFGESSGTHLVINNGAVEFHTNETTFPVSVDSDGVDLGSEATVSIKTGGIEDTTLSAGGLSVVGREPTLNISAFGSVGESTINLEADNVLVNGEPIGGGGSSNSAYCSCRGTGTMPSTTSPNKVTLTSAGLIARSSTDDFLISDGGLKCVKSGVVSVSASIYYTMTSARTVGAYIYKGTTEITSAYTYGNTSGAVSCAPIIIPVNAGDIIYLYERASASATVDKANVATHLDIVYLATS